MEMSSFNRLEEKIEGFLARLNEYKEENARLRELLAEKERELGELHQKVDDQDQERNQVRQRIEQLVLKLESY